MDTEQYAREIFRFHDEFSKKIDELQLGADKIVNTYLEMFDKFCAFKIDDKVQLVKDVPLAEKSGWWPYRHFLKEGEKGTVKSRDWRDGDFYFHVVFDKESWIGFDGAIHKSERESLFLLPQSMLKQSSEDFNTTTKSFVVVHT